MGALIGFVVLLIAFIAFVVVQAARAPAVRAAFELEVGNAAKALFDGPSQAHDGYGYALTGTARGVALRLVVHESVSTYVAGFRPARKCVLATDLAGAVLEFSATYGGYERRGSAAGDAREAFARDWDVRGEPAVVDAVFDDATRAVLARIGARAPGEDEVDFRVESTREGLAIVWPGPLDARDAGELRELLLTLRERALAHIERAAGGAQKGVFRTPASEVRVDVADAREPEAEPEDAVRAQNTARPGGRRRGA